MQDEDKSIFQKEEELSQNQIQESSVDSPADQRHQLLLAGGGESQGRLSLVFSRLSKALSEDYLVFVS